MSVECLSVCHFLFLFYGPPSPIPHPHYLHLFVLDVNYRARAPSDCTVPSAHLFILLVSCLILLVFRLLHHFSSLVSCIDLHVSCHLAFRGSFLVYIPSLGCGSCSRSCFYTFPICSASHYILRMLHHIPSRLLINTYSPQSHISHCCHLARNPQLSTHRIRI